jgi:hypothetical protein
MFQKATKHDPAPNLNRTKIAQISFKSTSLSQSKQKS